MIIYSKRVRLCFRTGYECVCQRHRSFQRLSDVSERLPEVNCSNLSAAPLLPQRTGNAVIRWNKLNCFDNLNAATSLVHFKRQHKKSCTNLIFSWIRRNMGLFVCHCFILLVLFVGGVLMYVSHENTFHKMDVVVPHSKLTSSEENNVAVTSESVHRHSSQSGDKRDNDNPNKSFGFDLKSNTVGPVDSRIPDKYDKSYSLKTPDSSSVIMVSCYFVWNVKKPSKKLSILWHCISFKVGARTLI